MVKREFSIQILTRLRILAMLWFKLIFLEHNTEQGGDVCTQIGAISGRDSFEALQMAADCREQSMAHGLIIGLGP